MPLRESHCTLLMLSGRYGSELQHCSSLPKRSEHRFECYAMHIWAALWAAALNALSRSLSDPLAADTPEGEA